MGATNAEKPFEFGEIVDYRGEKYEVVKNFGACGIVKNPNDAAGLQSSMYCIWSAYGSRFTRVDQ